MMGLSIVSTTGCTHPPFRLHKHQTVSTHTDVTSTQASIRTTTTKTGTTNGTPSTRVQPRFQFSFPPETPWIETPAGLQPCHGLHAHVHHTFKTHRSLNTTKPSVGCGPPNTFAQHGVAARGKQARKSGECPHTSAPPWQKAQLCQHRRSDKNTLKKTLLYSSQLELCETFRLPRDLGLSLEMECNFLLADKERRMFARRTFWT